MALSTQLQLEQTFQIQFGANPEPVVDLLLEHAQAVIETELDRTIELQSGITETLDGDKAGILFLKHWPVTAVNSLTEDGVALVAGTDYVWYDDGRLVRGSDSVDLLWTWKRQSVVVDYDAGYAVVPSDLTYVSTMIAGRIFQASAAYANAPKTSSGVRRISLDGSDSVEFTDAVSDISATIGDLRPIELRLLGRHRRVDL